MSTKAKIKVESLETPRLRPIDLDVIGNEGNASVKPAHLFVIGNLDRIDCQLRF